MTLAEFLEWEERQPALRIRWRRPRGDGWRQRQARTNPKESAFALTARLRGKPCQFLGSDLKIQTEEDHAATPMASSSARR